MALGHPDCKECGGRGWHDGPASSFGYMRVKRGLRKERPDGSLVYLYDVWEKPGGELMESMAGEEPRALRRCRCVGLNYGGQEIKH